MPRKNKEVQPKSHYAIGHPWDPTDPNSTVAFYAYGGEIFHGTMKSAIATRDQFNRAEKYEREYYPAQKRKPVQKYRIYQVVEVPGSADFPSNESK